MTLKSKQTVVALNVTLYLGFIYSSLRTNKEKNHQVGKRIAERSAHLTGHA